MAWSRLARKTSGVEVNPSDEWFLPFNRDSRVHPYALDLRDRVADLFDLTRIDRDGAHILTQARGLGEMPNPVAGLDPISEMVAQARADARPQGRAGVWIPDERNPTRSFADLARRPVVSGVLTQQTGPGGDITEVPVLSFIPQPAHPTSGTASAEVMYFSGRSELPLAAVISFEPDPTVRERWRAAFQPLKPDG
jgi:hypothetical protein